MDLGPKPRAGICEKFMTDQQLELGNLQVEVQRRAYQRSLRITVRANGKVLVTTGRGTSAEEIAQFLRDREPWLKQAMRQFKKLREQYPKKRFLQGEGFLFCGELCFLNFAPTLTGSRVRFEVIEPHRELRCWVPRRHWNNSFYVAPQPQVHHELRRFYEQQGRRRLTERVEYWSDQMQLQPRSLSFRSQRTRWGSCTPTGKISLNWRLIAAPAPALDYVIIHELAHLAHLNHSSRFWSLVETFSPNHRLLRKWLRDHQYEFDFLAKESELHPVDLLDT